MMMRGGKDEAKVMSPMFPRLHVNDAEKGGPRAPPRNKMALYEQLSIPSQRFNSGSLSMLPFPTTNSSTSVPSISSSHDGDNERSMFMPFGNTPESSNLGEKFHSYHISGINLNTTRGNQERKLSKATDHQSLDTTLPIPSSSRSKPSQPVPYSSLKAFSLRKLGHEHGDDLRVPTPVRSGDRNCSYRKQNEGRVIFSKMQLQTANEKEMKETDSAEPKARRSDSIQSNRNKIFADTSSSLSTKIKKSESLKRVHPSSNQENKSSSVVILNSVDGPNPRLHQECVATQDKMIFRANIFVEPGRSCENSSKVRIDSCLRQPLGVENGSPNALENRSKALEGKKSGAIKMGSLGRHNNIPCASMESESPSDIFPDDVVRILGENKFWKVRSAIVNQQRVFAVQVFELHRLIKVQKLIAGSPNMLLEHTIFMGTPSLDVSPMKKLPSDSAPDPPSIVKVKDNSKKINMSIECADENAVAKVSLPSANDETSKGLVTQRSKYGTYSGNALSTPISANTRTSPWCVSPPGSQWLVPVMSPSEGLVYKPYTGPCPPTAGLMAPVYGSCGPLNLAAGGGEFLNTVYGVPASHQKGIGILPGNPPIGQTYFPHYGMPVMNPSVSSSPVEQMSPFTRVLSKGNRLSTGDVNFTIPHQSSCNMPSQMSQAISYRVGKLPASKDSEIQGSTASSPSERPKGDALPLFPIEPTTQASDHNAETSGQQTRVIKVVPRNPRLATETAARIFQSIQEERKQYD